MAKEETKKDEIEIIDDTKDDEGIQDRTDDEGTGETGSEDKAGKTFTQEQVNKMMAREKHQGANSVYKELGIDPKDTKAIGLVKALIASQKTDEQKAAEQSKALVEAQNKAALSEAKAEAMMMGVQPQFVEDAVTLAMAKMKNDEGSDIKTVLGELKTKYPVWFGKAAGQDDDDKKDSKSGAKDKDNGKTKEEKKTVGQRGTGSTVKTNTSKEEKEEKSLGARLAAKRRSQNQHKSLWSR